jgi:tRNA threonylcarbamoyladenosine biosynthesis protein TsaE
MRESIDVSRPFQAQTGAAAETAALGASLAETIEPPIVIALYGDLGSGKTEFIKGFVGGYGSFDDVSSPTFSILNTYYSGTGPIYHFDLYRVESDAELAELGFDEYLFGDGICLIEWAERAEAWLPAETIRLEFEHIEGSGRRIRRTS